MADGLKIDGSSGLRKQDLIFQIEQNLLDTEHRAARRRRARDSPRRLRLSAQPGLELSPRSGRHLRLALADKAIRSANGRRRSRPGSSAKAVGAIPRASQSGERKRTRIPTKARTASRSTICVPVIPTTRLRLETEDGDLEHARRRHHGSDRKGAARNLIVSPPRAGKTILLHKMANAIAENHPEVTIIMLLIDERPEEVTEMISEYHARRSGQLDIRRRSRAARPGRRTWFSRRRSDWSRAARTS